VALHKQFISLERLYVKVKNTYRL